MENKQQRPLFLGFSSQKGGVGKSTLAEIVSSILYYEQGINLFVMDCDLSQDSFYKLREREKSIVQESEVYEPNSRISLYINVLYISINHQCSIFVAVF